MGFFNNDLAGRIATKVFQSGHAAGDVMIGLLQIIWFIGIYTMTTMALLAALDWRLGLVVAVWIISFTLIARFFVVRVRKHGEITADTGSIVTGRLVDAYGNIPAMKMYASVPDEDRETRKSFAAHVRALANFTRTLTGMRISISVLNGLMIFICGRACGRIMDGRTSNNRDRDIYTRIGLAPQFDVRPVDGFA